MNLLIKNALWSVFLLYWQFEEGRNQKMLRSGQH